MARTMVQDLGHTLNNAAVSEILSASFHTFPGSGRFPGAIPRRPPSQAGLWEKEG
jgi:hypothetical protein